MKLSFNLLKQYFNFNKQIEADELSCFLTNLGFEVEEVEDLSTKYNNFIVAKILNVAKHPDSTKLNLCKVDTGSQILDIVCGAQNVRPNLNIVLAKVGAIVPLNGMEIKKGIIRSEKSEGMICSAEELGMPKDGDGILELSDDLKTGLEFAEYLNVKDFIFHISITPNRGDGASVLGIARDLEAKELGARKSFFTKANATKEGSLKVDVSNDLQSKLGQVNFAKTTLPNSLQKNEDIALFDSVWGSSNLIPVDISNLTMFLTGAPNHIYDASKIKGDITIDRSLKDELFIPIKGDEVKLPEGLAVVRDEEKILSLLGVMGDARSKCTEQTSEVIIEALHITQDEVIKSSRATNIKSDSSYRFERGVDFAIQSKVLNTILNKLDAKSYSLFHYQGTLSMPVIELNSNDYLAKIGSEVSLKQIKTTLEKLEFRVQNKDDSLQVSIPSFRNDVTIKEGLCSEVARIIGFEAIKPEGIKNLNPIVNYNLDFEIKKVLQRGMNEVITYSFFKDEFFGMFYENSTKISLKNPITKDLAVMRDSLIPNLLSNISQNERKSYFNNKIFEVGTVFFETDKEKQVTNIASTLSGLKHEKSFLQSEVAFSVWDIKQKMLEVLYEIWGFSEGSFNFKPYKNQNMHTSQSFEVFIGKNKIGILGQVHPLTLDLFEVKQKTFIFEIYTSKLPNVKPKKISYKEDILPDVIREIAIIISSETTYEKISSSIKKLRIKELKEINIKDIFEDPQRIGESLKSISLQFKIKQDEITLSKEIIDDKIIGSIVKQLSTEFNAKLRDGEQAK